MLHNIFKKTKKRFSLAPLIIADIHEKNSLVISHLYKSDQVRLEKKPLKIADYLISDIAIERKTASDLINSMINKRLIQQLIQMQKYPKSLLIVEGDLNKTLEEKANLSKAVRGLLLSISINYCPIILSKDYLDTAKYLIALAKQQSKSASQITLHSKIPKTKQEQKSYILESFPNIGPKTAQNLLKKFKTISRVMNASEEELFPILKNKTKDFKELLDN